MSMIQPKACFWKYNVLQLKHKFPKMLVWGLVSASTESTDNLQYTAKYKGRALYFSFKFMSFR